MSDVKIAYLYNPQAYTGKPVDDKHNINQGRNAVLSLVKVVEAPARNIMVDNFPPNIS